MIDLDMVHLGINSMIFLAVFIYSIKREKSRPNGEVILKNIRTLEDILKRKR
jgi:hypothetical protein